MTVKFVVIGGTEHARLLQKEADTAKEREARAASDAAQLYVVEPECGKCGAPRGEGITAVRARRDGEGLSERSLRDDEIPVRFVAAAAAAHPRWAIKEWRTCADCWV